MKNYRAALLMLTCTAVFSIGCKSMEKDKLSLPVYISQEFSVMNTTTDRVSNPIPDQKPTTQTFVEVTKEEKKAYIFYWGGPSMRDLGPMAAKESWQHKFLGEEASVTRTKMFMGQEQEVLVLHHKPTKDTQLMIYSKDMNKDEFHEMLDKMRKK